MCPLTLEFLIGSSEFLSQSLSFYFKTLGWDLPKTIFFKQIPGKEDTTVLRILPFSLLLGELVPGGIAVWQIGVNHSYQTAISISTSTRHCRELIVSVQREAI